MQGLNPSEPLLPRHQWLMCNGMQGNAVPHLQFMAQSVPPSQIVIMLGKGTQPLSGPKPECSIPPPLILHFNHCSPLHKRWFWGCAISWVYVWWLLYSELVWYCMKVIDRWDKVRVYSWVQLSRSFARCFQDGAAQLCWFGGRYALDALTECRSALTSTCHHEHHRHRHRHHHRHRHRHHNRYIIVLVINVNHHYRHHHRHHRHSSSSSSTLSSSTSPSSSQSSSSSPMPMGHH